MKLGSDSPALSFITTATGESGAGGDVGITVSGKLEIAGNVLISEETTRMGSAGDIWVGAGSLEIGNCGRITSSTAHTGHGGRVELHADQIRVEKGGLVATTSDGVGPAREGDAGDVTLVAAKRIEVEGVVTSASSDSGDAGPSP